MTPCTKLLIGPPGLVALSLTKTIKSHPALGWVRANQVGSTELLSELNDLRKRNQELEKMLVESQTTHADGIPKDLAGMGEEMKLRGSYIPHRSNHRIAWFHTLSWSQLFALIAPDLLDRIMEHIVKQCLAGC